MNKGWESEMKSLIMFGLLFVFSNFARGEDFEFHYGDKVKVHSRAWQYPCYVDDFINYCDTTGYVIQVDTHHHACVLYKVRFDFEGVDPVTESFCGVHLKLVGRKK